MSKILYRLCAKIQGKGAGWRKTLGLCLCAVWIFVGLTGCGNASVPDAQSALCEQFAQARTLYFAVYGDGFAYDETVEIPSSTAAFYVRVTEDAPYQSCAAFREAIRKTYTASQAETLCYLAFDGDTENGISPRYKDDEDGKLCVNVKMTPLLPGIGATADLTRVTGEAISNYAVRFTVLFSAGGVEIPQSVTMQKEDGVWKFDSPPYCSENPV